MDLVRGSFTAVDSDVVMENVGMLSNGNACDSHLPADDVAASTTSVLFGNKNVVNLSNGETLLNSSVTNTDLVSHTEISDNCDSVLCQMKDDTACKKPDANQTAAAETDNRWIADDAIACKDGCFSLLQDENSHIGHGLLYEDSQPVDLCKLGSTLWPKSTFVMSDVIDYSFMALTADHENYCCKENAEDITARKEFLSGCEEAGTLQHNQEVVWPIVSRCLKESTEQFSRQFPTCSALINGLLNVNSDSSSDKLNTSVDEKQAHNSASVSLDMNTITVSLPGQINNIANCAGLNTVSESGNHVAFPAVLSRDKILSLRFSGVSLTSKVILRIKELKLKRTGGVLWPTEDKRMTRNTPSSKELESNSSSITMLKSASALTEIPVNSANTKGAYKGKPASKPDAISAVTTDTVSGSDNFPDACQSGVQYRTPTSSNFVSDISTHIGVNGITQSALSGHITLPSMTLQSNTVPIVSHFSPVSDLSADTSLANVTFSKAKSAHELHSAVETTHEVPLKTSITGAVPLSSSAALPLYCIATANESAVTHPKYIHSITTSELVPQAACDKPLSKKYNRKVTDISETLADHNYHRDFVPSSVQQHIPQPKHSVTNRNPQIDAKLMKERHHKSRKDSQYIEGSASPLAAEVHHSQSRSKSRRAKCSHCQHDKSNTGYAPSSSYQSHASRHETAYNVFDHYNAYRPCYMPDMMTPSVIASVSYSSYYLGAYDAHVRSMHYYNMLSHQSTADMWQQQAEYIRRMAKFYAQSQCGQ